MDKSRIRSFLESFRSKREKTLVIVDYGNVVKWEQSLGWKIGIKQLSILIKNFSLGKKSLRRFYYGSDYGDKEKSFTLSPWSETILRKAKMNNLEVLTKKVKYIHNQDNKFGFEKKCDLDVEMSVDLIKERNNYNTIILFSGDGDLVYSLRYLKEEYKKECFVFGARGHIGREIFDAKKEGIISDILFIEDFEYRLNMER